MSSFCKQTSNRLLSCNKSLSTLRAAQSASNQKTESLKHYKDIPGPRSYPIVKTMPALIASGFKGPQIYKWFLKLHEDYGSFVRIPMPLSPDLISTTNVEDIEKLCRVTMDNPVRFGFESLKNIRLNTPNNYFDNKTGLLPENGDEWWRVRSRVQTHMMKPKNVHNYLASMDQVSSQFMDRISEIQAENNGEVPKDFNEDLYKWALESVCLVALNRRLGCLEKGLSADSTPMKIIKAANDIFASLAHTEMDNLWKIYKTAHYKTLVKAHQTFVEIVDESIRDAENEIKDGTDNETIMTLFLQTPGLTRTDVMTMLLDTIMAGIDTTSHTLLFIMYNLAKHPESQTKLQEEVDRVVGRDNKDSLTAAQINQMHYLKAVIKESLRIQPLVPGVARQLTEDTELSGYTLPKDTVVFGLTMVTSLMESSFKDASKFLPERWLRSKPLGDFHHFASLPFSHGKRMCVGRRIAEQELFTFLIRMVQRYKLEYNYDHPLTVESKLVFIPTFPLNFSFKPR